MQAAAQPDREFLFSDRDFKTLSRLVYERVGIVLGDHKRDMVYARLARRLRSLNFQSFEQYCGFLSSEDGESEIGNLVNAITTNLTSFFREPHHFEHLKKDVLMPLLQKSTDRRLRIWSAGCSTGAEPYSIAMVLSECLGKRNDWDAKILATDIDTNVLATAKAGHYPEEWMEKIPSPYDKYVHAGGAPAGKKSVDESLKKFISFNQLNLIDESWPMKGPFDIVFCRNVVIYFDKDTQRVLFDRMADLMKPEGWLYIGHSEHLFQVTNRFKLVGKTIYRKAH